MNEALGRERVATALFYGAVLLLAWLVYRIFEPFLVPLGWGAVLVVVFHPWHARLEARWGATKAAAASTALVTLIVIVPVLLLAVVFAREGLEAVRAFPSRGQSAIAPIQGLWDRVQAMIPVSLDIDLVSVAGDAAQTIGTFLASKTGTVVANVFGFFFDLFVTLFATFFLFRDQEAIVERMRLLLPFTPEQRSEMIARARDLIHASVTASFVIAVVQGLLGGLAFAILGLDAPVFWGVVMAFFALIPLLGTGVVLLPAAVWLFATGSIARAIILLAIGLFVIGLADNLLRPVLVSGRAQMSTLVLFISVLGGIGLFGMLGLVLGPIVVATATSVMDVYLRSPQKQDIVSP